MEIHFDQAPRKLGEITLGGRKELGYSQEGLAAQCGIYRTYLGTGEVDRFFDEHFEDTKIALN
ncbi:MAG: hypothetical protein M2R45_02996 [Verrucomicrobia subdivision 3 bacterium]|nr:hypothetical protein [Limisphaerales bacterium]MCS1416518.1 hypothetical protein [Limisphaerales bacterium]